MAAEVRVPVRVGTLAGDATLDATAVSAHTRPHNRPCNRHASNRDESVAASHGTPRGATPPGVITESTDLRSTAATDEPIPIIQGVRRESDSTATVYRRRGGVADDAGAVAAVTVDDAVGGSHDGVQDAVNPQVLGGVRSISAEKHQQNVEKGFVMRLDFKLLPFAFAFVVEILGLLSLPLVLCVEGWNGARNRALVFERADHRGFLFP